MARIYLNIQKYTLILEQHKFDALTALAKILRSSLSAGPKHPIRPTEARVRKHSF